MKNDDVTHREAVKYASNKYFVLKAKISKLESSELTTLKIDPKSRMHIRDKRCSGQYSHYLQSLYRISLDCLDSAIKTYDVEDKPIAAHEVLIRTAIECSSIGIWLLAAGTDQKAAFNTLKMLYGEADNAMPVYGVFNNGRLKKPLKALEIAYSKIQKKLDNYASHDISNQVNKSQLVDNADKEFIKKNKRERFNGLWAWRACSAMTHGNTGMVETLSDVTQMGDPDKAGNSVGYLQPNPMMMVLTLLPAVENMEQFYTRFMERARPEQSRRRQHRKA